MLLPRKPRNCASRAELKSLATLDGTSADSESIAQKQRAILDDYALYRQDLARKQFEVADLESQLGAQKALLEKVDTAGVSNAELDALLTNDPTTRTGHPIGRQEAGADVECPGRRAAQRTDMSNATIAS